MKGTEKRTLEGHGKAYVGREQENVHWKGAENRAHECHGKAGEGRPRDSKLENWEKKRQEKKNKRRERKVRRRGLTSGPKMCDQRCNSSPAVVLRASEMTAFRNNRADRDSARVREPALSIGVASRRLARNAVYLFSRNNIRLSLEFLSIQPSRFVL